MEEIFVIPYKGLRLAVSTYKHQRNDEWVLFLHGIQSNKGLFVGLLRQPFLKKYSLLALDFVGFGNSSKPEDFSYDIRDQAEVVKEVIRKLGIKKLHIIGHSLGGMVGIILASQITDITGSLINMEGNLTLADSGLSITVDKQTFEDFHKNGYKEIRKNIELSNEAGSKKRVEWLKEIPDFAFYKTCKSIIKWAKSEKLLKLFLELQTKKLFIYGERNAYKIKTLSSSVKTVGIANAGHFMILENPDETSKAIESFLKT